MLSNYYYENILLLFGYNLRKARKEISRVKKLSRDDFKQWQETKRWKIVNYHFNNNNFYKDKVGSKLPDRWEKLPIIEKKHFQKKIYKGKVYPPFWQNVNRECQNMYNPWTHS